MPRLFAGEVEWHGPRIVAIGREVVPVDDGLALAAGMPFVGPSMCLSAHRKVKTAVESTRGVPLDGADTGERSARLPSVSDVGG